MDKLEERLRWKAPVLAYLLACSEAADEITRLKSQVTDLSRQLAAQKDFAASVAWTGAKAQGALATIQLEARRDGVRLVHLKRCIANAVARSSGKAGSDA